MLRISPGLLESPVPVSPAVSGLLELVELTVSVPVRVPVPVGEKTTVMGQVAVGARVLQP